MMEFDVKYTLLKDFLVQYFNKNLKPLIKLWIDKKRRELEDQKDLIKKPTRAMAKAKMQSCTSHNIDQRCYCGNQLVHASLHKASKDSKVEEPKTKDQKPKSPNLNNFSKFDQGGNAKTSNMARKEKKKQQRKEKQNKKDLNAGTPASEINATNNSNGKKYVE